jgi:predicted nucleic acid-binding protein
VSVLLDTNIVSELRKGARADARVRAWFATIPETDVFLSVIVLGEIRRGIERVRAKDAAQALALERWLQRLTRYHADRILPVDERVADEWGRFSAQRNVAPVDVLMAATARAHGLILATRNMRDVAWTGVPCLNPFQPPG